jgi:hypothetical protein
VKDANSSKEKNVLLNGKFLKKIRKYIILNILRSEKLKYLDEGDNEKRCEAHSETSMCIRTLKGNNKINETSDNH